jgi:pilus assembly protein CpaF
VSSGSGASAHSIIEADVRELVRRRGIDPALDPGAVARLIDEVIAEYLNRATTSPLPPLGDATLVARAVHDAVAGLGPLQRFLDDPAIDEFRSVR